MGIGIFMNVRRKVCLLLMEHWLQNWRIVADWDRIWRRFAFS